MNRKSKILSELYKKDKLDILSQVNKVREVKNNCKLKTRKKKIHI